jgi:hypothetical protein
METDGKGSPCYMQQVCSVKLASLPAPIRSIVDCFAAIVNADAWEQQEVSRRRGAVLFKPSYQSVNYTALKMLVPAGLEGAR